MRFYQRLCQKVIAVLAWIRFWRNVGWRGVQMPAFERVDKYEAHEEAVNEAFAWSGYQRSLVIGLEASRLRWRLRRVMRTNPSREFVGRRVEISPQEVAIRARLMWLTDPELHCWPLSGRVRTWKQAEQRCIHLAKRQIMQRFEDRWRHVDYLKSKKEFFAAYQQDPESKARIRAKWDKAQAEYRRSRTGDPHAG